MPAETIPTPKTRPEQLYECDCCGSMVSRDRIAMVIAYGIETGACDVCRGAEPEDDEP